MISACNSASSEKRGHSIGGTRQSRWSNRIFHLMDVGPCSVMQNERSLSWQNQVEGSVYSKQNSMYSTISLSMKEEVGLSVYLQTKDRPPLFFYIQ